MKFGYARVSKNEQNLDIQLQKLQQAGCDEIFQEKVSGSKDDRSQLGVLCRKGHIFPLWAAGVDI
jgi:DNA invertase Pin-like site-specific DNA recombinase